MLPTACFASTGTVTTVYALTIVALEEKLLALMDKYQQLADENEAFKQSLQNTNINEDDKGILLQCIGIGSGGHQGHVPPLKFSVSAMPTLYMSCTTNLLLCPPIKKSFLHLCNI